MRNKYILLVLILLTLFIGDSIGQKKQLNVFTWAGYVSDDIREGFEKEFGVTVLVDTYASNEDLLTKLLAGATGYDIIMPSDYMVSILIKQNLLGELNRDNIPNFQNISPLFLGKYFDAENQYSIPYTFGTAGIAYDSAVVSPAPDSWAVLWDTQYKNQFSMLDDRSSNKLNRDNIPNFQNISPLFLGKYFDAENQYSIPYTFGTAGIAYDSAVVSPAPDSWSVLWNTQYKNQFSMLDDQRETIGAALKLLGYSLNTTDLEEIKAAKEKLIAQKPLVKQYKSEAEELLIAGDVVMAHCWSGDAFRATETRPTIRYVIPKEGSSQFIDAVCIPKSAPHKVLAEQFINYLLRPEVNAKITAFTKYGTCVPTAKEFLPEHLREHKFIYPPKEVLESLEWLKDPGDFTRHYDRAWEELKAK